MYIPKPPGVKIWGNGKPSKIPTIEDLKDLLKRNINIIIEYSNLKDITEDYIDSLSDKEIKDLMKVYQESLMKKTEELIKDGKLRKSFLD